MNNSNHEEVTYTFDNLVIGSRLLGETRQLEITVPKPFSTPNAEGNLRLVKSYDEVGSIANQSAKELIAALK